MTEPECKKMTCPFRGAILWIPPHGDREDAMRLHLPECRGFADDGDSW